VDDRDHLYDLVRRTLAGVTDAAGFLAEPDDEQLLGELLAAAGTGLPTGRFPEPPWRFVVVVGDEREQLVTSVAEALARHWGFGSPRGLASDKVLSAPALVLAFSTIPSSENMEAVELAAAAAQNLVLLAHAAGLGTHRIYSPHLVPEAVLDWAGERLGTEIRRAEVVSMLAIGHPSERVEGEGQAEPPQPGPAPRWIGRAGASDIQDPGSRILDIQKPALVLRAHGERVLVVDPYPYNRDLLAAHLGAAGYDVQVYSHGQELLAAAAAHAPDLFIVAESLPDVDGLELVRRVRTRSGPQVPVLVTTGRRDSAFRIGGLSAGVDYYLRKPIHPIELYTAARILLERHRLVDELRRANGELARLLGELRAAQARLVQQAKMASLGQLVAGVAHEINTPLGAVISNNDLFLRAFDRLYETLDETGLLTDASFQQTARDLDAIVHLAEVTRLACRRMTGIVESLRTFARLDEAEVKAVDLHEGIESTLVLIAHLLRRGVAVEKHYATDLPPVECHPNQINQVFMNLMVNACQAIEAQAPTGDGPRGTITIETARVGADRVRVSIADSGTGIPEEHLPRIFDPGFTTKGVGVGTGLGLSICYQIVEVHHGEITVESVPGHGARFTVVLPIRRAVEKREG
jgi:signal transduction histidine kinase